jgi:RNA polymerase sigma factor (sigma-70 family)
MSDDYQLLLDNDGAIHAAVNRYYGAGYWPGNTISKEEAYQCCWLELMRAINRFDSSRGHITSFIYIVVFRAIARLADLHGLVKDHAPLRYDVRQRTFSTGRLDRRFDVEDRRERPAYDPDEIARIPKLLSNCTTRERDVLWAFAEGMTGKQIASRLGVSRQRVYQIASRAYEKCREAA